jgi:site-specific DNA-cytosine methylase
MLKPIAVIDLYCGMGGFTEGAIQAGAKVILSCDFWDEAVKVHKLNHPDIPCLQLKLGTPSDWKLIKKFMDKYPNHHIHLHGSPPCQALSNASTTDPSKGMVLVLHFLDMVEKLKPDSWSMENVVPMRKRLPEGTPSVILNSADFGVPQTRRRCIAGEGWVANPSHTKEEWISVIEALPHLNEELRMDSGRANAKTTGINPKTGKKEGGSGFLSRSLDNPSYTIMTSPRNLVVNVDGASNSNSRRAKSADVEITSPSLTLRNNRPTLREFKLNMIGSGTGAITKRALSYEREIERPSQVVNNNTPVIRHFKLEALGSNSKRNQDRSITEPSKTICGSGNQVGARIFNHQEKPTKIRSLTVAETLILQGFNPDFDLSCTKTKKSRWTMVGNAVCPPVAKAIIEGIGNG